jgi:hypothetical protein
MPNYFELSDYGREKRIPISTEAVNPTIAAIDEALDSREIPVFVTSAMSVSNKGLSILQEAERALAEEDIEVPVVVSHMSGEKYPEDPAMKVPPGIKRVQIYPASPEAEAAFWDKVAVLKQNRTFLLPRAQRR